MCASTPADRIPARSDAQARKRLTAVLQQSLTAVTKSAIWVVAPIPGSDKFAARTEPAELRLTTNVGAIYLRSTLQFEFVDDRRHPGERKARTAYYAHSVGEGPGLKPQLYSWEWSDTEPRWPHVHVHRGGRGSTGLGKLHIPTGRVFFEHVLLFLIHDHGVQPQRTDWEAVLDDSLQRVLRWSAWGGVPQLA